MLAFDAFGTPAPDGSDKHGDGVLGEPHDFSDLAHGHPGAVVNDCCRQSSAFAAVFFVYVLDDLFASLMFEIDIDIWRLVPFGGYEALEQKINPGRIDGCDAQAVTDGGISRRATALAENALRPGITDDIVNGQKVGA